MVLADRSSAPPFRRPPPNGNPRPMAIRSNYAPMIRAGNTMLRRESDASVVNGRRARFNTPPNHRSSLQTSSTPLERPQPPRTPRDGILVTFPIVNHVNTPLGEMLPINHRMQPTALDSNRGTGYHTAPPSPGRNNTTYAENYRQPDSLNSSPMSIVPMNEYAKGGRVKKTGVAKVHKDEVVLPVSVVKQLTKLMKNK